MRQRCLVLCRKALRTQMFLYAIAEYLLRSRINRALGSTRLDGGFLVILRVLPEEDTKKILSHDCRNTQYFTTLKGIWGLR